jgi:hypothetical protein
MSIAIDTANRIHLDGQPTGLAVTQRRDGTVVYTPEGFSTAYREHRMPHARYSLAHDAPASGAAGRAQFEADLRALLASM